MRLGLVAAANDSRRYAGHGDALGDVLDDHRVGADAGTGANADRPQNLGAGAHDHAVLDRRMALLIDLRGGVNRGRDAAQGDAVVQRHVVADLGGFADHDPRAMVDEEPFADHGPWVDLDSRQEAPDVRDEARQQAPAAPPRRVRQTMHPQSVETGIAQRHLEARPDRGVALEHDIDLFSNLLEHGRFRRLVLHTQIGQLVVRTVGELPIGHIDFLTIAVKFTAIVFPVRRNKPDWRPRHCSRRTASPRSRAFGAVPSRGPRRYA